MFVVAIWLLCALAAGIVASSKGRSGIGWFLLSLLLFGILGLLIVGFMPSLKPQDGREAIPDSRERVACPACRELIIRGAEVCRFCGAKQVAPAPAPPRLGRVTCKNCGRNYPGEQQTCGCGMTLR